MAQSPLAAAICMAVTQLIGMFIASGDIAATLPYGLSLSFIAFGGTYAGVFVVSLAARSRRNQEGTQTSAGWRRLLAAPAPWNDSCRFSVARG
ncbi:MAG: hypothetical protein QM650_03900 [Microlunatus sp.]